MTNIQFFSSQIITQPIEKWLIKKPFIFQDTWMTFGGKTVMYWIVYGMVTITYELFLILEIWVTTQPSF